MGVSASIQNQGTGNNNTVVTEAFDTPGLTQTPAITIDDSIGNGSGFPDPGEPVLIELPLTNNSGVAANNVSVTLTGGGSADLLLSSSISWLMPTRASFTDIGRPSST